MILDALVPRMPIRYFRLFWGYAGARILVIVGLTMLMSYAEGLGIALFLPLFSQGGTGKPDAVSASIMRVFDAFHLSFSAAGALPVIALIFVAKGALLYATTMYALRLANRTVRVLRGQLLGSLGRADYAHVIGANAGVNANLIVTEVGRSANGFLYYVRSIPPAINAAVFFGIVLLIDWHLTLVCVCMGLTVMALLRLSGSVAQRYSTIAVKESAGLTSLVIQALQAFKYLRATAVYRAFEKRLLVASEKYLSADLRASAAGTLMLSVSQPVMVLFLSGILYYRVAIQGAPIASLFVVLMYFLRIMAELFALQTSWQAFCSHIGSVEGVRTAIADADTRAEPNGSVPFQKLEDAIRCRDLWFAYADERFVLRGIDLSIASRSTVAFVGASGSGKSTLVDLLMGTLKPTKGGIELDSKDLRSLELTSLRSRAGYVPQDSMVFDDTVANNIALWRTDVGRAEIESAAKRAQCAEFIEAMPHGYDEEIGDRGIKLSGGQRQRLAIARELLKAPEILVLDEATSALDSESEMAIRESIARLKGQMTIVMIAHRLSTVRGCDRIFVLHEGQIAEQGSYEELIALPGGRFRQMVDLQDLGEGSKALGA